MLAGGKVVLLSARSWRVEPLFNARAPVNAVALASCSVVPGATVQLAVEPALLPVRASVPPLIVIAPLIEFVPLRVSAPPPVKEKPAPVTGAEMVGEQLEATLMVGVLVSVSA